MTSLDTLGDAVDAIESRFCCTGEVELCSPLTVNGAVFPVRRADQDSEVAKLRAIAEPSPFGQGNKTVVDPTVRKAVQIKEGALDLNGWTLPAEILDQVRRELVPDAGAVTATLHKLNIYETGGFFADHKDTPRSETHFGSLFVCLPAFFTGGTLAIDHLGEQKNVSWERSTRGLYSWQSDYQQRMDNAKPRQCLQWAAFFGDANHRVDKVTSGARITLAYELHRDGTPDPFADALLLRAERVRSAFLECLRDAAFMPSGGQIGFECVHLYEEKDMSAAEGALAAVDAADASARKIKGLKNEDNVLAVAAAAAGLRVESRRVLSNDSDGDGEEWVLRKMPKKADVGGFGRIRNCDGCRMRGVTDDEVDDYAEERFASDDVQWVSKRDGKRKPFAQLEYAAGGLSFGNEASTTTFYTRAVLLVDVPPRGAERTRVIKLGSAKLTSERVHASKATMPPPKPTAATQKAAATTPAPKPSKAASAKKRRRPDGGAAAAGADDDDDDDDDDGGARATASTLKTRTKTLSVMLRRIDGSLGIALADDQITAVHAGGAGAQAGLLVGDLVREVNGKAMHMASFGALLPKSKEAPVKLSVHRLVKVEPAIEALLSSRKKGKATTKARIL